MNAEAAVLGGVDIHVKSGHGVDPYFDLPMLESMHEWQKMWFFLRIAAAAPLHTFTSNRPIPRPNWSYGVAKKELHMLQPLHKVVQ
jgi:hypothetical protein